MPDMDMDGNGTVDCIDQCKDSNNKVEPGICGYQMADADLDQDSIANCIDKCPFDMEKMVPGVCGCGGCRQG